MSDWHESATEIEYEGTRTLVLTRTRYRFPSGVGTIMFLAFAGGLALGWFQSWLVPQLPNDVLGLVIKLWVGILGGGAAGFGGAWLTGRVLRRERDELALTEDRRRIP